MRQQWTRTGPDRQFSRLKSPVGPLHIRVPFYFGELNRDPSLEKFPDRRIEECCFLKLCFWYTILWIRWLYGSIVDVGPMQFLQGLKEYRV